ncbi:MAG: glycoside hydrolase family 97 protein [Bacteroidales bacterium]|nr:MAG: glycoside hydrolase family 97 protein [Bacteroidales bacterium]
MCRTYLLIVLIAISQISIAKNYQLQSPDGKIELTVKVDKGVEWSLMCQQKSVIDKGSFNITINQSDELVGTLNSKKSSSTVESEYIESIVPTKFRNLSVDYSKLIVQLSRTISVEFRLYNNGFAYRLLLGFDNNIAINNEDITLKFPDDSRVLFPKEDKLQSHYERIYVDDKLSALSNGQFSSLPLLVQTKEGVSIVITDADLYDYPCLFLKKVEGNTLKSLFPKAVNAVNPSERGPDRNEIITAEADYIARTNGRRSLPWRVFAIAETDKQLLENQLVYNLSRTSKDDFSWVKPGKVAWDWWNDNNIWGVDFKSGINTETYKYYIDFAADFGLEYIILDEGWSASTLNLIKSNEDINIPELIEYGKSKNVGVILWVLWKPFYENIDKVLNQFKQWGVVGVKVDFMQRADQQMVNVYETIAAKAAEYKMLVDFHGAFKPSGLSRAYPNVLTYEGVKGLENCKWSDLITPEHNLTLPFTRMVAGPMDYTPGAMINRHKKNYSISWSSPMSIGTRAHQVALYVVFESPLQMLSDNPSNYRKEMECTQFIAKIPSVFDVTYPIDAKIGKYLIVARKTGDKWYLAALNNQEEEREFEVSLDFLDNKKWKVEVLQDGINADKHAEDYKIITYSVIKNDKLKVKMVKGGGFTAIIIPEN